MWLRWYWGKKPLDSLIFFLTELYGKDNIEAMQIDAVIETASDIRTAVSALFSETDEAKKVWGIWDQTNANIQNSKNKKLLQKYY